MRPSVVLDMKRIAVREAIGRFRTATPRVFGPVLHGTDQDRCKIDLLVDARPARRAAITARHSRRFADADRFAAEGLWGGTMTDDNTPPMFGSSFVIDPVNHELRSEKGMSTQ